MAQISKEHETLKRPKDRKGAAKLYKCDKYPFLRLGDTNVRFAAGFLKTDSENAHEFIVKNGSKYGIIEVQEQVIPPSDAADEKA